MNRDRPTSNPGGCECEDCGAIFIGGPCHHKCGVCAEPTRESVSDALLIVESYGPWGPDLNDAHRRQIVLADEVKMLREALRKLLDMDPAYMRGPKVEEAVEAAWVALGPNV